MDPPCTRRPPVGKKAVVSAALTLCDSSTALMHGIF